MPEVTPENDYLYTERHFIVGFFQKNEWFRSIATKVDLEQNSLFSNNA